MEVLYNGSFKNKISRKMHLKFDNMFIKKFSFYIKSVSLQYSLGHTIFPVLCNIEILQSVFFHVLIPHGSDLGLSVLRALCTLT